MLGIKEIHRANEDAAARAERWAKEPYVIQPQDVQGVEDGRVPENVRKIPYIGSYLPSGWQREPLCGLGYAENSHGVYFGDNRGFGAFFVDSSGFGSRREPALTIHEFLDDLHILEGYGLAIVERGEFQLKIGVFSRE